MPFPVGRLSHIASKTVSRTILLCALAVGGALALAAFEPRAQAMSETQSGVYVIPAGGYGVDECVATSAECGRIVATAWCEAHGHGRVVSFGSASDVTFTANVVNAKAPKSNSIIIACAD